MGCMGSKSKTIKNYRKSKKDMQPEEPASPKSPNSCKKQSVEAENPMYAVAGIQPSPSPPDPTQIVNVFVTTPCQIGVDFTQQELELIWANYSQQEGTLGELDVAVLVGHIFDAMPDQLVSSIGTLMVEEMTDREERDAKMKQIMRNVDRLVQKAREEEAVGIVNTAVKAMSGPTSKRIPQQAFMTLFKKKLKDPLDMVQLDVAAKREEDE